MQAEGDHCSALIAGGGAPEIHVSRKLAQHAQTLKGMEAYCFQAYAEALEVIPTTLAENAGLNPISIVTELRNRHAQEEKNAGINVRKGMISDIREENVLQPLLVSTSAVELATETVGLLLKIDDYSPVSFIHQLQESPVLTLSRSADEVDLSRKGCNTSGYANEAISADWSLSFAMLLLSTRLHESILVCFIANCGPRSNLHS